MKYQKRTSKCSVDGCSNPIKAKELCGKHYERMRAHGNVHTDNRATGKKFCEVTDCFNFALARGLCNRHYSLWLRNGVPETQTGKVYGSGHLRDDGYKLISVEGKPILEHIYLAEKALGRKLPEKAIIHHMNNIKDDNHTPFNLVICPNQEYHFLLHRRAEKLFTKELTLSDLEQKEE